MYLQQFSWCIKERLNRITSAPASPISQKTQCTTLNQWFSIPRETISVFNALAPCIRQVQRLEFLWLQNIVIADHCVFFCTKEGLCPSQCSVSLNEWDKMGRVSIESGCVSINEKREALDIYLPMVQCSPFHPWWHSHLPSLQVPCFIHRGLHTRWSHASPVQPSSQRHEPPIHTPWVPQSTEHTSADTQRTYYIYIFKSKIIIKKNTF